MGREFRLENYNAQKAMQNLCMMIGQIIQGLHTTSAIVSSAGGQWKIIKGRLVPRLRSYRLSHFSMASMMKKK